MTGLWLVLESFLFKKKKKFLILPDGNNCSILEVPDREQTAF